MNIKRVTGFRTKPKYVEAIQVMHNNINEVKSFCDKFREEVTGSTAIAGYISNYTPVEYNGFIVKDGDNFTAMTYSKFMEHYERCEE